MMDFVALLCVPALFVALPTFWLSRSDGLIGSLGCLFLILFPVVGLFFMAGGGNYQPGKPSFMDLYCLMAGAMVLGWLLGCVAATRFKKPEKQN